MKKGYHDALTLQKFSEMFLSEKSTVPQDIRGVQLIDSMVWYQCIQYVYIIKHRL